MITTKLREAFQFFRKHAGYATPPGPAACALRLARAELWANDRDIEWVFEPEQESYKDVYGEEPPEGAEFYCLAAKCDGEVVASLGFVEDDAYLRVIKAELLVEAQARVEEMEAATATAVKIAERKDAALAFVRCLAVAFRDPHEDVNGGDLVETVGRFLDDSGLLAEAQVAFIEAHGLKVERESDAYTVTGPGGYHVTGNQAVLGKVITEHGWSEDEDDEAEGDGRAGSTGERSDG